MSGLFGGSSKNPQSAFQLTGGGTGAPWNWGVSPFDQSMIDQATTSNKSAITNRYNQLGLGGSSMEATDLTGAGDMGTAMTGQLQTQNEANPALNPAEQPPINSIVGSLGTSGATGLGSSLSSLAGLANGAGGLSSLLGGAAGAGTLDSVLSGAGASDILGGAASSGGLDALFSALPAAAFL